LVISDEMRDAIVADPTIGNLRKIALRDKMITLGFDGFRKVREGMTTVEEILHIVGDVAVTGGGE
jgi:type IV pilus assembly protein PilB